jgi:putative transposase
LRSYGAARRQVIPTVEHRSHKSLNNRAENSHLPFRKRERMRQGFRSLGSFAAFRFAVLRRPQSLRSRSHKTYCQSDPRSQTASHGSVESRQWPARPKLLARALTRRSFKQRDSAS